MKRALLDQLLAERSRKRAVVLFTWLPTGRQLLWTVHEADPPPGLNEALRDAARDAARFDRPSTIESDEGAVFVQPFNPPLRLVIVGAVHIAQALAQMATATGFEVVVIDPRGAFATTDRFPAVTLTHEWPDAALEKLSLDHRSAVVTLTHDPKLDDPALGAALGSPAFYIGCLGSRKTHAARLARLEKAGFGPDDLKRIHGPVGLPIGAKSTAEIAVSILAQVIEALRVEPPAS